MTDLIIFLAVAVLAASAWALMRIHLHHKKQKEHVRRQRSSDLYGHLYPLLLRCNKRCVESITIRTDAVCIRLYRPAGRTLLYTFEKHGFDALSQDAVYALAQAIAVDLPLLQDRDRYTFTPHAEALPSGDKGYWYEYMITTDYKDSMIRADYLSKKQS